MDEDEGMMWAGITTVVGLGVATLARKAMARTWAKRRGSVPGNPGEDSTSWQEAALFAVLTGAAVGISRLVADRAVVEAKKRTSSNHTQ